MGKLAVVTWLSDVAPEQTESVVWGWARTLAVDKCAAVESALASDGVDGILDLFLAGEAHGGLGNSDAATLMASLTAA